MGGLGFSKGPKEQKPIVQIYGPDNIKYFNVKDLDKKKRKGLNKGLLGISHEDKALYFLDLETKEIALKINLSEITKSKDKKTKITLELGKDTLDFEGEKGDIHELYAILQDPPLGTIKTGTPASTSAGQLPISELPRQSIQQQQLQHQLQQRQSVMGTPEVRRSPTISASPKQQQAYAKVAIALYDYTPIEDGELAIKEGAQLMVLDDSDPDWWLVKQVSKTGGKGLVPRTYVEIKAPKLDNVDVADSSASVAHKLREEQMAREQYAREIEAQEQARIRSMQQESQRHEDELHREEARRNMEEERKRRWLGEEEQRKVQEHRRLEEQERIKAASASAKQPIVPSAVYTN